MNFRLFALLLIIPAALPAKGEEARLLRFPAVGNGIIAFSYAGDLYTVPIDGGQAVNSLRILGTRYSQNFLPIAKPLPLRDNTTGIPR
jgi:tricorn protease